MRVWILLLSCVIVFSCSLEQPKAAERVTTLGPKEYYAPNFQATPKRVVVLNTPSLAYLDQLKVGKVVIASMSYSRLNSTFSIFKEDCSDLGNTEPSVEKLLSLNPDMVILNPFQMENYTSLKDKLNFFVMDEYSAKTVEEALSYYDWFSTIFNKTDTVQRNITPSFVQYSKYDLKLLKLDAYNNAYFVPECMGIWKNTLRGYVEFICNSSENTKVSKEKMKLLMQQSNTLVVFRNGDVPSLVGEWLEDLKVNEGKGLVYCNTEEFPFFEFFSANPEQAFQLMLDCASTQESNAIFKWKAL